MVAATAHASVRYYSHVERPNRMNADNPMKTTAKPTKHDWSRFDAMSEAQRTAAAMRDRDAVPLTSVDFKRMKRTPQVKLIRRALGLTQDEFARRFHIPLASVRSAIGSRVLQFPISLPAPISP